MGLSQKAQHVPGLAAANKFMADNECDLIGVPAMPAALIESEDIYAEIHRIEDRHVDHGDAEYYSTPEQHLEFLAARLADTLPRRRAYTATLLKFWPVDVAIEDTAEYVLENARRFATAKEAEHADTMEEVHCLAQHGISGVRVDGDTIRLTKDGQSAEISLAECRTAAQQDDLTLRLAYERILRIATALTRFLPAPSGQSPAWAQAKGRAAWSL